MKIQELKVQVRRFVSDEWVRENFGKLTRKATWEDAYDRCKEFMVVVAEEAVEEAVGTVVLLADNSVGLGEAIADASIQVLSEVVACVFYACCFYYLLGQAFGERAYRVRWAAAQIEAEDLTQDWLDNLPTIWPSAEIASSIGILR
jgi:hypothetical protein